MRKLFLMILCLGVLTTTAPLVKTDSGRPEVSINTSDTESVKAAIINKWLSSGYIVESESSHRLLMSKTLTGGGAIMAQMLFGNSYSTTPKAESDFSIYTNKGITRVIVTPYISTQMAMGQTKREDMTSNGDIFNDLYNRLLEVKKEFE
jgi:hypothetical protein